MTCEDLEFGHLLFAMGVLDEPELSELRAHLERGCEQCTAAVREARQLAYGIGASIEGPEPPRALRKKILSAAGVIAEPRSYWLPVWQFAALAVALVLVFVGYQSQRKDREIASLQQQITGNLAEAAHLRAALNLLQAPETREVVFGQGVTAPPRGRVYFNRSGVLLIASNLPAPPSGKTYEMWIIPRGGKPAPAGLFTSGQSGTAAHFFDAPTGVSESDTVAVTLEPAGGVSAPTSQPLIAVAL